MYHDAKGVFYSANVFQIGFYTNRLLSLFVRQLDCVSYRVLAVRNMDLRVVVSNRKEERQWDNGFCALAESVKNLRDISIFVDENYEFGCTRQLAPACREEPFPLGLLELKKLPLKTFSLSVQGQEVDNVRKDRLTWTSIQKREWVQYVKGVVLGSD